MASRNIVIDLDGNLSGKAEERGTRLCDDLRLHELSAALQAINDALEAKDGAGVKVRGLFSQALAEFVARADSVGSGLTAISVELNKAQNDRIRVVFEVISRVPDSQT